MMRFRSLLALTMFAATALAGCATPTVDSDAFTIETHAAIPTDDGVTLRFLVAGDLDTETDHVGGHYWYDDEPEALSAADSDGGCAHQAGDLPGDYTVLCSLPRIGTAYVYAHARAYEGDETFDYWGSVQMVEVKPDENSFQLTVENLATDPATGSATFDLVVAGDKGAYSDHIGGHYWAESTEEPTVATAAGACAHVAGGGDAPDTFQVACDMGEGTWYYRGHFRLTFDDETWEYWTNEMALGA